MVKKDLKLAKTWFYSVYRTTQCIDQLALFGWPRSCLTYGMSLLYGLSIINCTWWHHPGSGQRPDLETCILSWFPGESAISPSFPGRFHMKPHPTSNSYLYVGQQCHQHSNGQTSHHVHHWNKLFFQWLFWCIGHWWKYCIANTIVVLARWEVSIQYIPFIIWYSYSSSHTFRLTVVWIVPWYPMPCATGYNGAVGIFGLQHRHRRYQEPIAIMQWLAAPNGSCTYLCANGFHYVPVERNQLLGTKNCQFERLVLVVKPWQLVW